MSSLVVRGFSALLVAAFLTSAASAKTHRVTIGAAPVERAGQVVSFKLPADARGLGAVSDASGALLPLQSDAAGNAQFIVPAQKAGEVLVFTLVETKAALGGGVDVKRNAGNLEFLVGGKPAFGYQMDKEALPRADIKPIYKRAGYLHPVFTPSGTLVSDDYPAQHVHHHGIWSPWTKTTFQGRDVDFWNMAAANGGTVEFVALDKTWSGPVAGGFVARHKFVDLKAKPEPVTALNEVWEVTAYDVRVAPGATPVRMFDLVLTQTCATNDPLILPKYHYGGLGYRGRGDWFGETKANFLSSEGGTDRVKLDENKMRWVHIGGAVEGGVAGFAVLGHPGNFRAPQPVRVHPKEPYVSFTPSWEGDWKIEPGTPYVARYRFIAADGAPDRARLDAFWNGYATPAVVKVAVYLP